MLDVAACSHCKALDENGSDLSDSLRGFCNPRRHFKEMDFCHFENEFCGEMFDCETIPKRHLIDYQYFPEISIRV